MGSVSSASQSASSRFPTPRLGEEYCCGRLWPNEGVSAALGSASVVLEAETCGTRDCACVRPMGVLSACANRGPANWLVPARLLGTREFEFELVPEEAPRLLDDPLVL